MKPPKFEHHAIDTAEESPGSLATIGGGQAASGGQSLMPMINLRVARPARLVDLNGVSGLDYSMRQRTAWRSAR